MKRLLLPLLAALAFLSFLSLISIKEYPSPERAKSLLAAEAVAIKAKECAIKNAKGIKKPTFSPSRINKYKIFPEDRDCNGDENNLITAQSINTAKYPNYSYNVETGEKTCSHDGPSEKLYGCSTRRNGKW